MKARFRLMGRQFVGGDELDVRLGRRSGGRRRSDPRAETADNAREAREAMVDRQIEARGVRDPAVLKALRAVPRHEFVPRRSVPGLTRTRRCPSATARPSVSRTSSP
jgi:hypothetical protein